MNVELSVVGEIVVNDEGYLLYIDTSCHDISSYQNSTRGREVHKHEVVHAESAHVHSASDLCSPHFFGQFGPEIIADLTTP